MELIQDILLWAYILICFMIIWYGVSLVLSVWEWLRRRRSTRRLVNSGMRFAGVWAAAWLVTTIGMISTSGATT